MDGFDSSWLVTTGIGILLEVLTAASMSPGWKWGLRLAGGLLLVIGLGGVWRDFTSQYELRLPFALRQVVDDKPQFPKWPDPYSSISVVNKTFKDEEVLLDGYSYINCTFENVTFVYNGTTPAQVIYRDVIEPSNFRSDNLAVNGTAMVFKGLGYLRPGVNLNIPNPNNIVRAPGEPVE